MIKISFPSKTWYRIGTILASLGALTALAVMMIDENLIARGTPLSLGLFVGLEIVAILIAYAGLLILIGKEDPSD